MDIFLFLIRLYDKLVEQWTFFFFFLIRLSDILVVQWTFFLFFNKAI